MESVAADMHVPDVPTVLRTSISSSNTTFDALYMSTTELDQFYASTIFCTALLVYIAYRYIHYFTSELPPFGSGLKRLPGPISTLPYVGRVHDVDRMQAWHAMKRFSDQYDGLFACTLGGETHIWVAREDVAQDLLCKHAAISSARADLGAYPDVTKGNKYLPLLGYNGKSAACSLIHGADGVLQKLFTVSKGSHMRR